MERVYVGYFITFLLVLLGAVLVRIFIGEFRKNSSAKNGRDAQLRREAQTRADREKAFQDKWGR